MTSPNQFTLNDTLAARELVKTRMTPAFRKAIDNGDLDQWGMMTKARAEVIRARKAEEDMADG